MGVFDSYDFASAPADPYAAPVGTWPGIVSDFDTFDGVKDPSTKWVVFEYKSVDPARPGRIKQIFQAPDETSSEGDNLTRVSWIKQTLSWLEVPESQMNTIERDDLVNLPVTVTTKKSVGKNNGKEYTNVSKVSLRYGDDQPLQAVSATEADAYDFSMFKED